MKKTTDYDVRVKRSAEKNINRLPKEFYERIASSIRNLETDPRPHGYKRLSDRPGYRIRVGDYRIVYKIDDKSNSVEVLAVGHRSDIYKKSF
jgi:mRNA interferase RelE/StbE